MPKYEIRPCPECGADETIARMNAMTKDEDGRTMRRCLCGTWCLQAYRTAINVSNDGAEDKQAGRNTKPVLVKGLGEFNSYRAAEAAARAGGKDLIIAGKNGSSGVDSKWEKHRDGHRNKTDAYFREMGYKDKAHYQQCRTDTVKRREAIQGIREKMGKPALRKDDDKLKVKRAPETPNAN